MVGGLYLHEAMAQVLEAAGGDWVDRDELARHIAEQDLYRRKDGSPAPSDQMRLRARKRPDLFECSDTRCTRVRLRVGREPEVLRANAREPGVHSVHEASDGRADEADSTAWYQELRDRYRPHEVNVLLIGESPPDPGAGSRRFFYARDLTHDNLYRGVAQALYGDEPDFELRDKPAILDRIKADGLWLIDAVTHPINKTSTPARRAAIKAGVPHLVRRCEEIEPRAGLIICHGLVYELVAPDIRAAGIEILHDQPLPFPLGNWRAQFIDGFRQALR